MNKLLTLCAAGFIACSLSTIQAANAIWDGLTGVPGNWTADNWSGGGGTAGAPSSGDELFFGGNTTTVTNNDFASGTFGTIRLTNNGTAGRTTAFTLGGNDASLGTIITTPIADPASAITDVISLNIHSASDNRDINSGSNHHLRLTGTITGQNFVFGGPGDTTLTALNAFTGFLATAGSVTIHTLGNEGTTSSVGTGATLQIGASNTTSTLNYIGSGSTSDRRVQIGSISNVGGTNADPGTGAATITNNGTGALQLNHASFNIINFRPSSTRILTLGGTNTDDNRITGVIADHNATGGKIALTKADAGNWRLDGLNTFTGDVNIDGGTLQITARANAVNPTASGLGDLSVARTINVNNGATLVVGDGGNSDVLGNVTSQITAQISVNGGTLISRGFNSVNTFNNISLNGATMTADGGQPKGSIILNGTVSVGGSTPSTMNHVSNGNNGYYTLSNVGANGRTTMFNVTDATSSPDADLIISSVLKNGFSNQAIASNLRKTGAGTMSLTGNNEYTGTTTVQDGKLIIDGLVAGDLSVAPGAELGGSGTLTGNTTISGNHSPGSSPGIQTFGGDLDYTGVAPSVTWELLDNTTTNQPNPNAVYDQVIVGGNLDFQVGTTLDVVLDSLGSTVDWANVFWTTDQSWLLYDVAGTLSNPGNLTLGTVSLDAGGASLAVAQPGASFSLSDNGQDLFLTFTAVGAAVPEPGTWALFLLILGIGSWQVRQKTELFNRSLDRKSA